MAQGEFTKSECENVRDAVNEMFEAIPKSKRMGFLGHLNDTFLFLNACNRELDQKSTMIKQTTEAG